MVQANKTFCKKSACLVLLRDQWLVFFSSLLEMYGRPCYGYYISPCLFLFFLISPNKILLDRERKKKKRGILIVFFFFFFSREREAADLCGYTFPCFLGTLGLGYRQLSYLDVLCSLSRSEEQRRPRDCCWWCQPSLCVHVCDAKANHVKCILLE